MMKHLLITGTGRSGTTLLVDLLDRLGLDTRKASLNYYPEARAGLEISLADPRAPYVVKHPLIDLRDMIESADISPASIDLILIPVRNLEQVTLSRKLRSASTISSGVPGGLAQTRNPWRQAEVMAVRFYALLEAAAEFEIPVSFLHYPRFAQDLDYAYRRLTSVLDVGVDRAHFIKAWNEAVDKELIRSKPLRGSVSLDTILATKWIMNAIKHRVTKLANHASRLARPGHRSS